MLCISVNSSPAYIKSITGCLTSDICVFVLNDDSKSKHPGRAARLSVLLLHGHASPRGCELFAGSGGLVSPTRSHQRWGLLLQSQE